MLVSEIRQMIKEFWPWMLAKSDRKAGFRLLLTRWLFLDAIIAAVLSFGLRIDGFEFAEKALFPAASILVGMAVAWTARAALILNDQEFNERVVGEENPIEDYVYGFQLSMLVLFSCIVFMAIMASGGFRFYVVSPYWSVIGSSFLMYMLISMTLRECWSIINFANLLSLLSAKVREQS